MKDFDWKYSEAVRTPQVFNWLKENYTKPVSQDEYVQAMNQFRGLRSPHNRTPSRNKREYADLKRKFGFFPTK